MSEPVTESAHYLTFGETGLYLVQQGRLEQSGPVQGDHVKGRPRRRTRARRLVQLMRAVPRLFGRVDGVPHSRFAHRETP